ncbi:MAG: hypothetical protein WKF42_07410 [Solirubrobacteraceae bacterium]
MNAQPTSRELLIACTAYVLFATAAPRPAYRMRWPTRLGPRGLLVYIAGRTLFLFSLHHYLAPQLERIADERGRLEQRLGREATDDELAEHFGCRTGACRPARSNLSRSAGPGR